LKIKAKCFKIKNPHFSEKSDRPFFKIGHFKNVHFQKTSTTFFLDFFILFYKETEKYKSNNIYIFIQGNKQTNSNHPPPQTKLNHPITQSPNHPITQSPNQKKKEGVVGET
jgi:hypothetical protein